MTVPDTTCNYSREATPPWWAGGLLRPPGVIFLLFLALGSVGVLWESRLPGDRLSSDLLSFLYAIVMGIALVLRLAVRCVLWKAYRKQWAGFLAGMWRVPAAMVLIAGVCWLAHLGIVAELAFRASEPAMRRMSEKILTAEGAKQVPSTAPVKYPSQSAGMYTAQDVTYLPDSKSARFYIQGAGFIGREGFAFSPSGTPREPANAGPNSGVSYTHKRGEWYDARETF